MLPDFFANYPDSSSVRLVASSWFSMYRDVDIPTLSFQASFSALDPKPPTCNGASRALGIYPKCLVFFTQCNSIVVSQHQANKFRLCTTIASMAFGSGLTGACIRRRFRAEHSSSTTAIRNQDTSGGAGDVQATQESTTEFRCTSQPRTTDAPS
jgi:hypothetical protein